MLSPDVVTHTRRRIVEGVVQEKELRSEYPRLVIDTQLAEVTLNGKRVNLNPSRPKSTRTSISFGLHGGVQ
jgi:hypothetical protein